MLRRSTVFAALVALLMGVLHAQGQSGSSPFIEFISFPSTIAADSKDVRGTVGFKDADGDVVRATFDVVKATDFKPFSLDLKLDGQREGAFEFSLASATVQEITLKLTLSDRAGHKSAAKEFSFAVQKEVPLLPDLQISINKAPTSAGPGQTFNVEYAVRNSGNSGSGRFRTGIYLARGMSVTTEDLLIGSRDLGFLSEGVSFNFTLEVTVPTDLFSKPGFRPGSLSLIAFVDDTQQVTESNENNNQARLSISIRNPGQAPEPPRAEFKAEPTRGPAPLSVQFSDLSSGEVTSISWDFGDGTTSADPNPFYVYRTPGSYTVKLIARGPGGEDTAAKSNLITVEPPPRVPPRADFSANPTMGTVPLTVQFTNKTTGETSSFFWDLGDGGTSTAQNPSYVYRNAGTYTVKLTARGPGGEHTVTRSGLITATAPPTVAPPRADFSANPTNGTAPLIVQFTNRTTGQFTSLLWDLGDGGTSTANSPSYTYKTAGTYTVKLTARGPGGEHIETKAAYITVRAPSAPPPVLPPRPDFSAVPTTGPAPLSVRFVNKTTGEFTSVSWDFGDGQVSIEQNPNHTYLNAGRYSIRLTARGPGGGNTETKKDYIVVTSSSPPIAAPRADFSANPTSGSAPLTVQFTSRSTGDINTYQWDFGDSTGTSASPNPSYIYRTVGFYTVKLTVRGSGGVHSETKVNLISVTAPPVAPPVADFIASPTSGVAPLTVQFTNRTTGQATSFVWHFGDGATSTAANPLYTYRAAGTYTVKLTANGPGGQHTATKSGIITVVAATAAPAPKADFSAVPTSGNVPLTVQFVNRTTGQFTSLLWEFGDGVSSVSTNPVYTYRVVGTYTVKLTARGPGGAHTETKANYITVSGTSGGGTNPTSSRAGLIAYYKFNEGNGVTAVDSSGNGNNGLIRGPVHVPGWEGTALRYNAPGDYVDIPNVNAFKSVTRFTMEAWINPSGAKSERGLGSIVMTKGDVWTLALLDMGGAAAQLKVTAAGLSPTTIRATSETIEYGVFTHIAVTYDGTTVRLYKNGKEIAAQAVTGTLSNDSLPLIIGGSSPLPSLNTGFEGTLDEVKFWSRALSAAELGRQVVNLDALYQINIKSP
jgi:PKD repeat protein